MTTSKRRRAELLGMPVGTAEKHLRKSIIHELAKQLGKNQCCRCSLEIEDPNDLAIIHVQEWEEDSELFWALTNIAFSHATCEAARSGKRQEKKQMSKVEVKVEDPGGKPLPGSRYDGDLYVAGKKDSRYQILVRNKTNKKVLVVITVDGRNVITGESGDHKDSGQVIGPRASWVFKGWRTSDDQVAAFKFGKKSGSYSAQLGSPENVGVIGCAVFEEEQPDWLNPWTITDGIGSTHTVWLGGGGPVISSSVTTASAQVTPVSTTRGAQQRNTSKKLQQRLGTEFGETLNSSVRTVSFKRATEDPCEVWVIQYDSLGALRERGIMVRPSERQGASQAFPESSGYCQAPSGVRRRQKQR